MKILILILFSLPLLAREYAYVLQRLEGHRFQIVAQKNEKISSMPGSLMKPFTAFFLLEKDPHFFMEKKIYCRGRDPYGRKCWLPKGHGWINLSSALAHSCNYYFQQISQGLSRQEFLHYLKENYAFPQDIFSYSPALFLGEKLSRPLVLKEISRLLDHLYYRLSQQDSVGQEVYRGLQLATKEGTLKTMVQDVEKKSFWKVLAGKTGTTNWRNLSEGFVYLVLQDPTKKIFTLLYYEAGTMGGKVKLARLLNILERGMKHGR
ncbi:MAG: penicillin-binding transpeptidase domain-containing protein [Leptospiraceae bacterium]|nr:penicillin-binding transpeptidase domain-containing protein [Leptospiraceae bacterium]MDW8307702.1 penicillin-binding transpeptidase domain-containing protein [Leptospiraceae bacterium]